MIRKIIVCLLCMFPIFVNASGNTVAKVGNKYYDSLEEAIINAGSEDIITLTSNVILKDTLTINKTVNINLNGNNISSKEKVFFVQGGVLNLSGTGTIKETQPNYGAIMVKGGTDSSLEYFSVVNIGSGVTLEGWSGVFINHEYSTAYGVVVNLEGKINAVNDINGSNGSGVYVNGNIKNQNNHPIVNIKDGALISSTGVGLYIAGYSTFNIGDAKIEGITAGIGIKSGNLNIDGATVICTGEDETPTEGYDNGIKESGTAIQIESNSGYTGNINIDIKAGDFTSKNSNVIYEYIGKGTESLVNGITISGGIFISKANKDVIAVSNSFKNKNKSFITGGNYSSDPSEYLKSGYTVNFENNLYKVLKNTALVFSYNNSNNNFKPLFFGIIVFLIVILGYFNRIKISKILKNIFDL